MTFSKTNAKTSYIFKWSSILCFVLFMGMSSAWAQVAGDFRSNASGNWNDIATWYVFDGTTWAAATTGQIPTSTTSVYIQYGHAIALNQNQACKDLNLAASVSKSLSGQNSPGSISLSANTLNVNGKLRTYYAAVGSIPGTDTTGFNVYPFSATSGKISIVGDSRPLTETKQWGATINTTSSGTFPLEINLNSGQTVTIATNIKLTSLNVVAGTLDMGTQTISPDNGTINQGDITIGAGTTILSAGTGNIFQKSSNGVAGTLTVAGTLNLSGASPRFQMNAYDFSNGTIIYSKSGVQNLASRGSSGTFPGNYPLIYGNITLAGTSAKTTVALQATTINGTLSMQGTASLALGTSGTLVYGSSSTLEYASAVANQTTTDVEFPGSGGPNSLKINNTFASGTVTLNSTKSLSATGVLTLTSGLLNSVAPPGFYMKLELFNTSVGAILGGNTSSYVLTNNLKIYWHMPDIGVGDYKFPIGDVGQYLPLNINSPSGSSLILCPGAYSLDIGPAQLGSGLTSISHSEFWQVEYSGGTFSSGTISLARTDIGAYNTVAVSYGGIITSLGGSITSTLIPSNTVTASAASTVGNSFNSNIANFVLATSATAPVHFINFSGVRQANRNKLAWSTATEMNNTGFDIQSSADGVNFTTIGFVSTKAIAGNSNAVLQYDYIDAREVGTTYYRLRQVDLDGKYSFSTVVLIKAGATTKFIIENIYPNPVKISTTLWIASPIKDKSTIVIADELGKIYSTQQTSLEKGSNAIQLNVQTLAPGNYFIKAMNSKGETSTTQFVKQ